MQKKCDCVLSFLAHDLFQTKPKGIKLIVFHLILLELHWFNETLMFFERMGYAFYWMKGCIRKIVMYTYLFYIFNLSVVIYNLKPILTCIGCARRLSSWLVYINNYKMVCFTLIVIFNQHLVVMNNQMIYNFLTWMWNWSQIGLNGKKKKEKSIKS